MILGISLSALGISVALVGLCINMTFTKPFVGGAYYSDAGTMRRKMRWGYLGNILLVIGTVGQLASLFL